MKNTISVCIFGVESIEVIKELYFYTVVFMEGSLCRPEKFNTSNGLAIDYAGVYNSNYHKMNNLGIKGSSGK